MILRIAEEQRGQTLPFVAGIILLIAAVLMTSLAISSISEERTNQQAIADSAALAGANAIAKANQTIKLINFIIWLRDAVLNVLYIAATIASLATLGELSGLFEIPLKFDKATKPAIQAMEKTKTVIAEIAPVYAVGNSIAYVQANNTNSYFGVAVPFPMKFTRHSPTAREIELKKKIEEQNREISDARGPMELSWLAYNRRKQELLKSGKKPAEISKDKTLRDLLADANKKSGRVGGLTGWRNRWVNELARLEKARGYFFEAGKDGLVAIVAHKSTTVPFSSFFGEKKTGANIAVSAAKSIEGHNDTVIGQGAIRQLFSKVPGLSAMGGALAWILGALNIFGRNLDGATAKYGFIGGFIGKALHSLNLVPPSITEERPVLISTAEATKNTFGSELGGIIAKINILIQEVRKVEAKFGRKVIPDGFEI